jgi:hypothetical protein
VRAFRHAAIFRADRGRVIPVPLSDTALGEGRMRLLEQVLVELPSSNPFMISTGVEKPSRAKARSVYPGSQQSVPVTVGT